MLHYAYQLVAFCVCLSFGAEQVVYSGFVRADESNETESEQ